MTLSAVDPICFGQYPQGSEPEMIHFQYEGQEDIFRYVLVERIPITEIDPDIRRKPGEGMAEAPIVNQYLKKKYRRPL